MSDLHAAHKANYLRCKALGEEITDRKLRVQKHIAAREQHRLARGYQSLLPGQFVVSAFRTSMRWFCRNQG